MKDLRRVVVLLVIGSFTLAAIMGIATLLGSAFGETQARVLLTTTVIGIESVAMLCYLSVAGGRWAPVGVTGALVSYVATGIALALTWSGSALDSTGTLRAFGVAVTIAATLAQASLLLALTRRRTLAALLAATLGVAGLLAVVVCGAIVGTGGGDGLARTIGVLAILDVLGTLVLIALGVFGGKAPRPEAAAPSGREVVLGAEVQARLLRAAAEHGVTPSDLVTDALDRMERARP